MLFRSEAGIENVKWKFHDNTWGRIPVVIKVDLGTKETNVEVVYNEWCGKNDPFWKDFVVEPGVLERVYSKLVSQLSAKIGPPALVLDDADALGYPRKGALWHKPCGQVTVCHYVSNDSQGMRIKFVSFSQNGKPGKVGRGCWRPTLKSSMY